MLSTARSRLPLLRINGKSAPFLVRTYAQDNKYTQRDTLSNVPNPQNTNDPTPANNPNPKPPVQNVSETNAVPVDAAGNWDAKLQEMPEDSESQRQMQAPNRKGVWSRSQQPRETAMSGPRFEQTIMHYQPQPQAAISLIHQQPVRWIKGRQTSCDGGGGPLGHPRIFINVDKPQICWCTYCGLPFAHERNKKMLQSLPSTSFPLEPTGAEAEVNEEQRVMPNDPMGQR